MESLRHSQPAGLIKTQALNAYEPGRASLNIPVNLANALLDYLTGRQDEPD